MQQYPSLQSSSARIVGTLVLLVACFSLTFGCRGSQQADSANSDANASVGPDAPAAPVAPQVYELEPNELLAMRLPGEESEQGWVRLFDGQSLFGWDMAGMADWKVTDGKLVVTTGDKSLLCTAVPWRDYEFKVDFKADAKTNSGIFFRTPLFPTDPKADCYELNIAPPDNPFPTGSLVGREKVELTSHDPDQWHTFHVTVQDASVSVKLNDQTILTYVDPNPLPAARIGLQHNSGRAEFKNVLIKPLGLTPLLPSDAAPSTELTGWKRYPNMQGSFDFDEEGNLHVQGGKGQLETESQFGDFVLLTRAQTVGPNQNSGIFFRCIPGEEMNGYECQINNDTKDGNPAFPADCGTGGFFRRQDARIIAAENDHWFDLLLVASGPNMAAWVNGIQVSQWQDTRQPDPNPRRGLRLEPGTMMIQAHDETTNVKFKAISIAPLAQ